MRSPALADLLESAFRTRLRTSSKQPTAPDLVSWSVGRMPAVAPGRAPRLVVTGYALIPCSGPRLSTGSALLLFFHQHRDWIILVPREPAQMRSLSGLVIQDSEIMSGTPVFAGTRVPVQSLWDHLEAGDSLDKFLDSFPSVSRRQAKEVLELAGELLVDRAHSPR